VVSQRNNVLLYISYFTLLSVFALLLLLPGRHDQGRRYSKMIYAISERYILPDI